MFENLTVENGSDEPDFISIIPSKHAAKNNREAAGKMPRQENLFKKDCIIPSLFFNLKPTHIKKIYANTDFVWFSATHPKYRLIQ